MVSIHAKPITRVRNVYCNEQPYSLAATEVFAKLHLLLATSCLLDRYHKTTQAGWRSTVNKPPVKWCTELYIKITKAGCWSVIHKPLATWWTELNCTLSLSCCSCYYLCYKFTHELLRDPLKKQKQKKQKQKNKKKTIIIKINK